MDMLPLEINDGVPRDPEEQDYEMMMNPGNIEEANEGAETAESLRGVFEHEVCGRSHGVISA